MSVPVCSFQQQSLSCSIISFAVVHLVAFDFFWLEEQECRQRLPKTLRLMSTFVTWPQLLSAAVSQAACVYRRCRKRVVPDFCRAHESDEESNQCTSTTVSHRRMQALSRKRRRREWWVRWGRKKGRNVGTWTLLCRNVFHSQDTVFELARSFSVISCWRPSSKTIIQ